MVKRYLQIKKGSVGRGFLFFYFSFYALLSSVRSMRSPTFSLLILLNFIDLQSLVPSLGGMDRDEPFMLAPTIPGVRVVFLAVRVASPASGERKSPIYVHDIPPFRASPRHGQQLA